LAKLYRRAERFADARRMFEHALENNSFDVPSILGLAELDNATGEAQRIEDAERRLRALLRWMPENVEARTLLGVTLYSGGKIGEAVACYERVLQEDPQHATAAINLAQIFLARGDAARADALFARAARSGPDAIEQVIAIEDRFITTRRFDDAVALWIDYLGKAPGTPVALSHAAWVLALAGKTAEVESFPAGTAEDSAVPLTIATRAYLALVANQHEASIGLVEQLCAMGAKGSDARRRLMTGLEAFDEQRPNVPWTFYLVARLLAAEGRSDAAGVFTGLFEQHCQDEMCAAYLKTLRDQLE
jgi:tetratricopeptide (TPR) repeat protein